jgi:uncharacterized protein
VTVSTDPINLPDYEQLVKFLFKPFLSAVDAIGVDCEYTIDRNRVWIRVAVAEADRGSAFGRGGRNIQAVRTVLQIAASSVGQSVHLDVYGNTPSSYTDTDRSPADAPPPSNRPRSAPPTRRAPDAEDKRSGEDRPTPPPPRPRR